VALTLKVRFDGTVLVPEQLPELQVGATYEAELTGISCPGVPPEPVSEALIEQRLKRLAAATGIINGVPPIPDEALRRENLYEERM
jgi:hypothetical protein